MVGFLTGGHPKAGRSLGHSHDVIRKRAILSQAEQMSSGSIVLLGDSLTELMLLTELAGRPVLNAGIGGARLSHLLELVEPVLCASRPDAVVVWIGINDAQHSEPRDLRRWIDSYEALVRRIKAFTDRVIVLEIHPVERGKPLGSTYFDEAFVMRQNLEMRKLAAARGLTCVRSPDTAEGLTKDGVHLNDAGYRAQRERLNAVVSKLLVMPQSPAETSSVC